MIYKAWIAVVKKESATQMTFWAQSNCQTAIHTDVFVLNIT
jgi:hypothetical protein